MVYVIMRDENFEEALHFATV